MWFTIIFYSWLISGFIVGVWGATIAKKATGYLDMVDYLGIMLFTLLGYVGVIIFINYLHFRKNIDSHKEVVDKV